MGGGSFTPTKWGMEKALAFHAEGGGMATFVGVLTWEF